MVRQLQNILLPFAEKLRLQRRQSKETLKTEATEAFLLLQGRLSGTALFLPTKSCLVVFLSAAPDPGQYSFDNDINNEKELLVTDKGQDSASQECGKESTALEPQHSL